VPNDLRSLVMLAAPRRASSRAMEMRRSTPAFALIARAELHPAVCRRHCISEFSDK
jgi:hypothetical protein